MKSPLNVAIILILSLLLGCSKKDIDRKAEAELRQPTTQPSNQPPYQLVTHRSHVNGAVDNTHYTLVEWVDLIPDDDLHALENPPAYIDDIEDGSPDDSLSSQLKTSSSPTEDRYQQALTSTKIRPEFNGRDIRIPGFIVPLDFNEQQVITTFFLVPFFGACLHLPPPPPNQIIYAEFEPGLRLEALYDPFWIQGRLSTTLIENEMATAAYSINVVAIEAYVDTGMDDEDFED
ncbi:hypothetical protein R50072_13830 [Simiduia litorea]|uniref:DUF3299 domain-containing protein n=1 Tax=Simiduia litorea TaxID=1435348 RepID=UPI0036F1D3B9